MTYDAATVDRQDAILAQRSAALDNGATQDAAGNIRATSGWDAGEVLGKDGLARQANGEVAVWLNGEPAWYKLGKVYTGDEPLTIDQVLSDAGLDFEVVKLPLFAGLDAESNMGTLPMLQTAKPFALVRTDTMTPLGAAGRIYTPFQNRQAFSFLQSLTDQDVAHVETAGMLANGSTVFLSMRLGEDIVIDAEGAADRVRRYVMITTRHDSQGSIRIATTPTRPVCANTVRWGLENAWSSFETAHTSGVLDRVEEARKTLKLTNRYYDAFARDARELFEAPMTNAQFDRFVADVVHTDADESAPQFVKDRVEAKRGAARRLFRDAATNATITGTRWGAAQALIEQIDHGGTIRVPKSLLLDEAVPKTLAESIARGARIVNGADDEKKTVIHKALLTWGR